MADPQSPPPEPVLGTVLDGRYRIDAELGRGGFGTVVRARHLALDHDVAIKLLHAGVDDQAAKRLAREAKMLARLDHPNCVRVMDSGSFAGAPYLVMELIEGKPLGDLLGQPWTPRRAVDAAIELLAGLAHAHALGLVHRDLKPGNVLVADARGRETFKIIDFGIVALVSGEGLGSFTEQLTGTGKIIGTPRYMSPEQLLGGRLDGRSDLYALGLILYEMLAGQPPFADRDVRELAWRHAVAPPPPLPDSVPDVLARIVESLLAKKPERRPPSAEQASARLQAIVPLIATCPAASPPASESTGLENEATVSSDTLERRIGRFMILRKLGEGGMGVVFLAYDEQLDRCVALKLVRRTVRDQRASARLVREARSLARLAHPHVVPVFEIGEHQGALFVAMEHVPGRSLRVWLHERARTWTETLGLIVQVGRGLAAAHALGLVHRDVKPDNVIVGDDGRARVLDFGLVRAVSPALEMVDLLVAGAGAAPVGDALADKLTRTGAILGTPAYMALEQLAGDEVDAQTDQFAFCVLAWEALYGERPFASAALDQLAAQLTAGEVRPRPAASAVPQAVHAVLVRGLAVMPDARWPNMSALLDALERAARVRGPWFGRALAAMVAGLTLVVGAAWGFGEGSNDDPALAGPPSSSSASESHRDTTLEVRNLELARALDRSRASLAALQPTMPAAWLDTIELAARHQGHALPLELRASLLTLGASLHAVHEPDAGEVIAFAWSPSAPLLGLASRGRGIVVWDASRRELIRTLDQAAPAALEFSHDGELLVAREPTRATLWHVATGTSLATIDEPGLTHAHFVPGHHTLVLASEFGVSWWSLVAGRTLERGALVRPSAALVELAGVRASEVLTITARGEIATWSAEGEALLQLELDAPGPILAARVAPDGRRVALVGGLGPSLWDATSGERIALPDLDATPIAAHGFSPDARHYVVAPRGRAPMIFDAQTGERRASGESHPTPILALAFDGVGRLLSLGDDAIVRALELDSGRVDRIGRLDAEPRTLAFGEGLGEHVATLDERGAVQIWATQSVGQQRVLGPRATRSRALARAPGRVAWTDPQGVSLIRLTDPPGMPGLPGMVAHEREVVALSLSPTGTLLVTLDGQARVRGFDLATSELVVELPTNEPAWTTVVALADTELLSVDAEGRIVRWTTDSTTPLASWSIGGPLEAIAVEADAIASASGAWPARVQVWTLDGQPSLALTVEAEVRTIAFSPDGQLLALAGVGPRVELWSRASATRTLVLHGDEPEIHALAFSPDSTLLAVGGASVRVWQLGGPSPLATLAGSGPRIHTLAFSPDAAWLEILRVDASVEVQLVDEAALLVRLCQTLGRGPLAREIEPSCGAVALDNR